MAQVPQALAAAAAAQRMPHSHAVAQAAQPLRQRVRVQRAPGRRSLLPRQRDLVHQLRARGPGRQRALRCEARRAAAGGCRGRVLGVAQCVYTHTAKPCSKYYGRIEKQT